MTAKQKKILIIAGAVIGLLLVTLAALVHFIDINSYKPQIEAAVSDHLGMDFRIKGRMGISFFPGFGVSLADVDVSNKGTDLVIAKKVRLGLKLLALVRHEVAVTDCELVDPVFSMEREADGTYNFETHAAKPKEKKELPLPLLTVRKFVISGGSIVFTDRRSGRRDELNDFDLAINGLSFSGRTGGFLKAVSFSGDLECRSVKIGSLTATNIRCPITAGRGIFNINPITMNFYGGAGQGSIRADFSRDAPNYRMRFSASGFRSEQFMAGFSRRKVVKGKMDLRADLMTAGKNGKEIRSALGGDVELRGEDLLLYNIDLDRLLAKIEKSRSFSLIDVGSYFFVGPFGPLLTKGYNFADLAATAKGGQSTVRRLISKWKVKRGVAEAEDVALSTGINRLAVKGSLDFVSGRYENVTVAVIDKKGCATVTQKITGPFAKPQIEKVNVLTQVVSPVIGLFKKVEKFLSGGKCRAFYSGSVKPPE